MPDASTFPQNNPQRRLLSPAVPAVRLTDTGYEVGGPSEEPGTMDVWGLVRKNVWIGLAFIILGSLGGAASVVLSKPIYNVRILLEVRGINEAWLKNSFEQSAASDQVEIQTQITLLRSGPFLKRVNARLQAETVPPPPVQADVFSRIRRRVFPEITDPLQVMQEGLETAYGSFNARPVNQTRLIELSCDSTSPQMAAQFINTMASEFMSEAMLSRSQSSQKTNEWLASQIEETKLRLQEAEQREQDFVKLTGNMFASASGTLDDSKLQQLQSELSTIQASRIAKQTQYEIAAKGSPETLADLLHDSELSGIQSSILDLTRERAALLTTLGPQHTRVQKIDAQLSTLRASLREKTANTLARLKNDYEAGRRQEELLAAAYSAQLRRVSSISGKTAENNGLKREVETLRQMYQGLTVQANQAGMSTSVPVNPLRLVEPATPPTLPYSPRPILNMGFGLISGLFLTIGVAFLREKLDRSVRHPEATSGSLNVPQLGVIPSAVLLSDSPNKGTRGRLAVSVKRLNAPMPAEIQPGIPAAWSGGPSHVADSFRGALASLTNGSMIGEPWQVLVVTSPNPNEGKTTVAANLAVALAEAGRTVLLVDADFRRPRLHQLFGKSNETGCLIDLLTEPKVNFDDNSALDLTLPTEVHGLRLLVNKVVPRDISKALYSPQFPLLIKRLSEEFDVILLDTPPLLHLADTRLIAPLADGVILVLRSGITTREDAREACRRIQADGLPVLGTILNDWTPAKRAKHNYYYEYNS